MSAVLDFRELRDKVLAGEMEDDEEIDDPAFKQEIGDHMSQAVAIGAVVATSAALIYDAVQQTSAFPLFGSISKASLLSLGVCLPLGYFVGAFSRGMEAQTQSPIGPFSELILEIGDGEVPAKRATWSANSTDSLDLAQCVRDFLNEVRPQPER